MKNDVLAPTPATAWSFSRVKSFHQCPLRYQFRYVHGQKEVFRSIESYVGNTVHDVLEWLYSERGNGPDPDEAQALQQLTARWSEKMDDSVAIIRIGDTEETYLQNAREMLTRFLNETFSRDQSETVSLEQRLSVRLSDTILFTGFADRVGRTENGRLFVIDYKTSKSEGNGSEFSEGLQAPLYAACVLRHHGEDEALAGYHYLRHGSTKWQQVDRDRAEQLLQRFVDLVGEVEAAADFPARPGILCAWCGFNAQCPEANVPDRFAGGLHCAEKQGRRLL